MISRKTRQCRKHTRWVKASVNLNFTMNADLPMPLYTFLEEYDFIGKTIIPFTTHGGSGFSRIIQIISELQPNATVISDGLSISRSIHMLAAY